MDISSEFLHYGAIALTVALSSLSVGISEGLTSLSALAAMNRQPSARTNILKTAIVGMTLIETAAILGLLCAILLFLYTPEGPNAHYTHWAELGVIGAICITGCIIGITSALPAQAACHAIARQPFFTQRILGLMLMSLVLIQTPLIISFLVSLFIQGQARDAQTVNDCLRLIASGLCIGIGSIGPAIGLSTFSKATIEGVGVNKNAYNKLLAFTFISEAIIETPVIFCLIIAIMLLFVVGHSADDKAIDGIIFLAAGLCTGLGTIGPGISSGKTAAAACKQIAHNPEDYSILSRTSMLAQGIIETLIIYAVLISFLLILAR